MKYRTILQIQNNKKTKGKKMKAKYKLIFTTPLIAITMGACRASYSVTVKEVFDNRKILVTDTNNEERLIDCSKKTNKTTQLLKDLPYFYEGDVITLKQARILAASYDGHRVFTTDDYNVVYPEDTIQIRIDKEIIAKVKADKGRHQR